MADEGNLVDSSVKKEKIRLTKKRDERDRSKEKMTKYYSDPENQARLQERIQGYKETMEKYRLKILELEEFVWTDQKK